MKDKTEELLFSNADLKKLIWPLLLEQLLTITMGMADTFMVSGVGEAAVSSVSLVDSLNILVFQVLAALATGGAVVASQYMGKKDFREAEKCAAQLYCVVLICTAVLMLVGLFFSRPILRVIFGNIEEDVMRYARTYFLISAISYPFMGVYNSGASLFRAQGNSRISMKASLVMNIINICGNAVLIYGFHLEVLGAALATLGGRVFAAVWVSVQQQKGENPLRITNLTDLLPERRHIHKILSIGIPSGLENGMFQIGKLCVSSLTSTLGTSAIAANAVANTISGFANIPGNTMNLAIIPVIGQCLGAGKKKQASAYAKLLMGIAFAGIAVTNVVLYFTIPEIAVLYHLSPAAKSICVTVFHWFNLFSIFFWAASFTLPNVLRSGGDATYTMIVSILSMWFFRVILSYLFVLKFHMGLTGVWFGMFIDWICRSVLFVTRFYTGKWMNHKLV
ncbi:MAG: MATE family efflux transporter [Blautia sp.]|nr:MATE family efflux transporter [Blautia sp.]